MRRTKLSLEQENPYHLCCNPRVGAWIHPKGGTAWPLSWWAEPRPSTSSPTQQFACNVCAEHQRAPTCGTMQAIMFSLVGVRCLAQLPHNTLTISLGGRYVITMVLIFPFLNVHGSETFLRSELDIKDFVPKLAHLVQVICSCANILTFWYLMPEHFWNILTRILCGASTIQECDKVGFARITELTHWI